MKSSITKLAVPVILFFLSAGLHADDEKTASKAKKNDTSTGESDKKDETLVKSISMLPIGKTNFGVKIPEYKDGRLSSLVIAAKLTPVDKTRIFLENVGIQTMDADGVQEMEIRMITGSFDLANEFLSSDDETVIERKDFTITGDSLDYDKKNGKGILRGKVKMVIRNEYFQKKEPAPEAAKTDIQETKKQPKTDEN
jgi:hypothetical protein